MKKLQRNKLSINTETLRLLARGALGNVAGGRIKLSDGCPSDSCGCGDTNPLSDRCQTLSCFNC